MEFGAGGLQDKGHRDLGPILSGQKSGIESNVVNTAPGQIKFGQPNKVQPGLGCLRWEDFLPDSLDKNRKNTRNRPKKS